MKKIIACLLVIISANCFAQDILKKTNVILIHGVSLLEVGNRLLDSGFTLKKVDTAFHTIETDAREQYHNSSYTKLFLK